MSQSSATAAGPCARSRTSGSRADILQRDHVVDHAGARISRRWSGRLAQAVLQPLERAEIELAVAPLQHADLVEGVVLEPVDEFGVERRDLAGDAEGAVVHVAAGAAGDLAELGRRQVAVALPVEFARCRRRRRGRRRG